MRDQQFEAGFAELGHVLECADERLVRALRHAAAGHDGGVAGGVDHHDQAEHPEELLVGLGAEPLDQIQHRLHLGMGRHELLERVGGIRDLLEALHDLDGGAAVVLVAEHLLHVTHEPLLQEPVLAVAVTPDLVHEDPAEFLVELRGVGIERDPLRPQELDPAAHPAPAVERLLRHHGDIVGHVDRLEAPHVDEVRLERRDPLGERLGLEILPLCLEFVGPDPEHVGGQAAKRTEGRRRQGHVWRHSLRALDRHHELQIGPLPADRPQQEAGPDEAADDDSAANGFDDPVAAADRLGGGRRARVILRPPWISGRGGARATGRGDGCAHAVAPAITCWSGRDPAARSRTTRAGRARPGPRCRRGECIRERSRRSRSCRSRRP